MKHWDHGWFCNDDVQQRPKLKMKRWATVVEQIHKRRAKVVYPFEAKNYRIETPK
jgi:hypothetical protein